jgi:integration host factor subunit alpha
MAKGCINMANRTLTRQDLLHAVYVAGPGLSRVEAKGIVETALEEICCALERGEAVKLRAFGTFQVRAKRPRVGRNPKTGHEYPISARRVLTFKPSPRLVAAINGDVDPGAESEDMNDSADTPAKSADMALSTR